MSFSNHQMSAIVRGFECGTSLGHQMSLAGWVRMSRGARAKGQSLYSGIQCPEGAGLHTVRSPVKVGGPGGSLYGEIQCIMGNGHMGLSCGLND